MDSVYPNQGRTVNTLPLSPSSTQVQLPAFANDLSFIARLVYGKLFRLAHGEGFDGVAQYRIDRIAEMLPYSKSAIEKALAELRRAGWITTWTNGRKSFCIPIVNLLPKELRWLEDNRHCAVCPSDSPASFTVPVRIRNAPGTLSSIRKNKSNQTKKKEQDIKTEAMPVVVVDVSASQGEERETVNEDRAVEHTLSRESSESKGEESIAAQLVTELKAEGVKAHTAEAIVTKHAAEPRRVSRNLTYVRRMSGPGREVGNRAGYIVAAIERDYAKGLDLSQVGVTVSDPGRKRDVKRAPQEPKPDKSTMYATYVPEEWMRDEPMKAPPTPVQGSVGASEAKREAILPVLSLPGYRRGFTLEKGGKR